ncbi:helix-turn-helix transcriptional regulator [Solihabitans fulvus]|uniref:Helix-turn-helix transcriptional regulator n=2 Tax=Solihabitans fulvus TaxID=1892852 RepID=A0A5B2XG62_9PSEU|nr:helix-turn-helix transcriptional regulator [Solihabitans fulvus]
MEEGFSAQGVQEWIRAMFYGERRRAGLTQEQLAVSSGVSVRALRRLESGDHGGLTVATLRSLADALGLKSVERDVFLLTAVDGRMRHPHQT